MAKASAGEHPEIVDLHRARHVARRPAADVDDRLEISDVGAVENARPRLGHERHEVAAEADDTPDASVQIDGARHGILAGEEVQGGLPGGGSGIDRCLNHRCRVDDPAGPIGQHLCGHAVPMGKIVVDQVWCLLDGQIQRGRALGGQARCENRHRRVFRNGAIGRIDTRVRAARHPGIGNGERISDGHEVAYKRRPDVGCVGGRVVNRVDPCRVPRVGGGGIQEIEQAIRPDGQDRHRIGIVAGEMSDGQGTAVLHAHHTLVVQDQSFDRGIVLGVGETHSCGKAIDPHVFDHAGAGIAVLHLEADKAGCRVARFDGDIADAADVAGEIINADRPGIVGAGIQREVPHVVVESIVGRQAGDAFRLDHPLRVRQGSGSSARHLPV